MRVSQIEAELVEISQKLRSSTVEINTIFADIRLAPGNSGGILANARGEIVGINVAIFAGLALAIPSQRVEHFIQNISP